MAFNDLGCIGQSIGSLKFTFGVDHLGPPLALGFGAGLMLMTLVPVLNFLAMPVGVTGATALWVERLKNQAASPPSGSDD